MASLDMSLDDMIKNRRSSVRNRGQGRSRGARRGQGPGGSSSRGGRAYGPPRRGPLGLNARPSAQMIAKTFRRTKNLPWQNGLLEDSLKAAGLSGLVNGTKLYVSNLDTGVTMEDIRDLFSDIGELMRYSIHYDKNGRSSGSAEVIFVRRSDAFQALKRYNNVQLDGKPMKVEIIGAESDVPISARVNVFGGANGKRTVVMGSGTGRFGGGSRVDRDYRGPIHRGRGGSNIGRGGGRGGGGGRGRGRGRGRGVAPGRKVVEKSAVDLDKELENYHSEAMQS
ncbi:THO complex subunit 4D-like isoform X1 [Primulina eburnea]|uniref:THO complex subunit 4D-like isoform X1 n=1 Tax=Primulina eburnea TaxID=1245227 RepID=UPI003C6BE366